MNRDQMKGQWKQLSGKAREQWGKLTDDDITELQGDAQQLQGRIQERYGYTKEQAQREVDDWLKNVEA